MPYEVTNPLMATEKEAVDVLEWMKNRILANGYVTVEEMYNKVFMLDSYRGPKDYAFGWKNLNFSFVKDSWGVFEVCLQNVESL